MALRSVLSFRAQMLVASKRKKGRQKGVFAGTPFIQSSSPSISMSSFHETPYPPTSTDALLEQTGNVLQRLKCCHTRKQRLHIVFLCRTIRKMKQQPKIRKRRYGVNFVIHHIPPNYLEDCRLFQRRQFPKFLCIPHIYQFCLVLLSPFKGHCGCSRRQITSVILS